MLIVSCGKKSEQVTDLRPASCAFVSCVTTLANALIGVRPHVPGATERAQRVQLLANGVYAAGVGVSREIVSLPAPRILRIYDVETGEPARPQAGVTQNVTLRLDSASVTSTEYLHVGQQAFELIVRQFVNVPGRPEVSMVIELQQTSSEVSEPRRLRLDYGIDTSAVNEYLGTFSQLTARHYDIERCECGRDGFSVLLVTAEHRLCYDVNIQRLPTSTSVVKAWQHSDCGCTISTTFDFAIERHHQLVAQWQVRSRFAQSGLGLPAMAPNFSTIESEHLARWKNLWSNHNVSISANGDPVEIGMTYCIFQLLQHGIDSHYHPHGFISPARGLTSTYHSGSTFFDTELHKCIFWIWNDPRVARSIIDYRYNHIEKAIEFAMSTGFSGARYPEASNDRGSENGPHYILSYPHGDSKREWSGEEVLHISADVCYAINRYWMATGDDAYMNFRGSRIAIECARFSASAFTWSNDKQAYVTKRIMGPDEYHYHVDNSFFTNYLLKWCLEFTLSLVDQGFIRDATISEIAHWRAIIKDVYLPWMNVGGVLIPEEFEGYAMLPETGIRLAKMSGPRFLNEREKESSEKLENFDTKLVKQADIILLMSLFPDDFSHEVKQAAFKFYEPRTVHESSLSHGPHAVVAADIGATEACASFITRASRYNLDFMPVTDYSNGLHLSAYAGAWQGLVEGLAGLRVDGNRLFFRPQLPGHWNSYRFALHFRGQQLRITVLANDVICIDCEGDKFPVKRHSDGRVYICGEPE